MGALSYGQWTVEFDDRLLTHLQIVIVNKFRRGDSFLMSWVRTAEVGSGRSSIWLTPSVPVLFDFDGSRVPTVDPEWITSLTTLASSAKGLVVSDELGQPIRVGGSHRAAPLRDRARTAASRGADVRYPAAVAAERSVPRMR